MFAAKLEHPFNFTMKTSNRITLVALFAVLSAIGLRAQTTGTTSGTTTASTAGGTTSGGTTTGGTTTGGTTTGGTTTGGTTTGGTTTGGSTTGGSTPGVTTTTNAKDKDKDKDKVKGPNENASQNAKDVHLVLEQFRTLREGYLAQRKELLEKLKGANDEEKKKILEQLRVESASRDEEERALGKQIRDDLKKLRDARKTG